jgi:hypothetical protein
VIDSIGFRPSPYLFGQALSPVAIPFSPDDSENPSIAVSQDRSVGNGSPSEKLQKQLGIKECQTCKTRKYQDVSNDPGVSFKAPTHVSPDASAAAVATHESEHVQHNQAAASRDGKKVISQTVQIFTSVCPECGRVYTSGGKTTTVTSDNPKPKMEPGKRIDRYVWWLL